MRHTDYQSWPTPLFDFFTASWRDSWVVVVYHQNRHPLDIIPWSLRVTDGWLHWSLSLWSPFQNRLGSPPLVQLCHFLWRRVAGSGDCGCHSSSQPDRLQGSRGHGRNCRDPVCCQVWGSPGAVFPDSWVSTADRPVRHMGGTRSWIRDRWQLKCPRPQGSCPIPSHE